MIIGLISILPFWCMCRHEGWLLHVPSTSARHQNPQQKAREKRHALASLASHQIDWLLSASQGM